MVDAEAHWTTNWRDQFAPSDVSQEIKNFLGSISGSVDQRLVLFRRALESGRSFSRRWRRRLLLRARLRAETSACC